MIIQLDKQATNLNATNGDSDRKLTCVDLRSLLKPLKVPIIVGIAGDSGSGKTTYSNCLKKLIGEDLISTIEMDGYHKEDREQRRLSGRLPLDPDANYLDLLALHLKELKLGKAVLVPVYNHNTGQFDPPRHLNPTPIIIVEGLHALYPEFLPYLDFSLYLDPDYSLKWDWKYERDVKQRGHSPEALEKEMLKREAAFRRWIDFQETNANVVVKMSPSDLTHFARLRFTGRIPIGCSKVELIMEPAQTPLPSLPLPFDLGAILATNQYSFMFVAVPGTYWGRPVVHIHLDGVFSQKAINHLEEQIVNLTGIPLDVVVSKVENEWVCAGDLAELLVIWRFLEQITHQLQQKVNSA